MHVNWEKGIASCDAYLPSHTYKPQQVIQSESFYHSTKAPLQVFMATTHDSVLFHPESDTGWTCGTDLNETGKSGVSSSFPNVLISDTLHTEKRLCN